MIRINLLAGERERKARRAGVKLDVATQMTIACGLILVATAVGVGGWAWSLNRQSAALDQQIALAQAQTRRLHVIIQQVQRFELQRNELQQRVALIEQLRKGQTSSVHLLDEVSRSLPDMLWLTQMKENGDVVTIEGRCTSLMALSDFVANLERSPYFAKPVELVSSETQTIPQAPGEIVRFTVRAHYVPPQS
ncbi:MAG TPA: PilN domain-containing protein [Vicinamibacterales bacterium]|nr:PilN domain-containing protein [Vicinamibacterales bacterium]